LARGGKQEEREQGATLGDPVKTPLKRCRRKKSKRLASCQLRTTESGEKERGKYRKEVKTEDITGVREFRLGSGSPYRLELWAKNRSEREKKGDKDAKKKGGRESERGERARWVGAYHPNFA